MCYLQQERTKLLALNDRVLSELKSNKKSAEDTKQKLKATEDTVGAMQNLNKRFIDELHKDRDEAKTNAKSAAESATRHEVRVYFNSRIRRLEIDMYVFYSSSPKTWRKRPSATPRYSR